MFTLVEYKVVPFAAISCLSFVYKTKAMKWLLMVQGLFLFLTSALTQGKLDEYSPCIDAAYYVQYFVIHILYLHLVLIEQNLVANLHAMFL